MKTKTSDQSSNERQMIRGLEHRTSGARQSRHPVERSDQPRQPKTGGTGGHGKKRPE